jgi:putative transposase
LIRECLWLIVTTEEWKMRQTIGTRKSPVEKIVKTIKAELLWQRSRDMRRQAERAIFEYINGFYNPRRRHSALGWKSPVAFERKVA